MNKVKKGISPEVKQEIEQVKVLLNQLLEAETAEATAHEVEGNTMDAEEGKLKEVVSVLEGIKGLDDQTKQDVAQKIMACMKAEGTDEKKDEEVDKANAEEVSGETEDGKKLQPGAAKSKKVKKDGNEAGTASNGSDSAETRLEDAPDISTEAIAEVSKSMKMIAQAIKSIASRQGETEKAMENLLEGLGVAKSIKETTVTAAPAASVPFAASNQDEFIKALKSMMGLPAGAQFGGDSNALNGNTGRENVRKSIADNLSGLLGVKHPGVSE